MESKRLRVGLTLVMVLSFATLEYFGYHAFSLERQAALRTRLKAELRTNTDVPKTEDLVLSQSLAAMMAAVRGHDETLYSNDPPRAELREAYAIPDNVLWDEAETILAVDCMEPTNALPPKQ